MVLVSFHIDGTERTCRTEVLTGTAADTPLRVYHRYLRRIGVVRVRSYHLYGSCRTVAGAVTAFHSVGQRHAVLFHPYGMADLDGGLVFHRNGAYRSGRTYLGTLRTLRTAVTAFVGHFRLHQCQETGRRAQHSVRASGHAKLACRAMLCEIAGTESSRRNNRRGTVGNLLVFDDGQSTVHFLFLCFQRGSSRQQ